MIVMGIDPGTTESAYAITNSNYEVIEAAKVDSSRLDSIIRELNPSVVACESIQSYGATVGREIFETCFWIGEYRHCCKMSLIPFFLYPRPEYAKSICGVSRVTDAVLRQSLLLRFGGDKKGEALHKLKGSSDQRSASGVAVYHIDKHHSRFGSLHR